MNIDFNNCLNALDTKFQTDLTTIDSHLLSTETTLQTQLPTIESDLAILTMKLHNTTEIIDQNLDDTIQELPFTIATLSTFTSSIDSIFSTHLYAGI